MQLRYSNMIGLGAFGKVHEGVITGDIRHEHVGQDIALKKSRVTNHVRHPTLLHEACALVQLAGHPNIPRIFAWGRSQYFEYLAMERLGRNLHVTSCDCVGECTRSCEREGELDLHDLAMYICQMLDVLQHGHEKGIVHCDIKPRNFVLGRENEGQRLYLIDFGLSRPYAKGTPGPTSPGWRGTAEYASLRVLDGHAPSPRDDIESLAYTLVHLLTGTLPWRRQPLDKQISAKRRTSGRELCGSNPSVFANFVDYARSLGAEDVPDYRYWRQAFHRAAQQNDPIDGEDDHSGGLSFELPFILPLPHSPRGSGSASNVAISSTEDNAASNRPEDNRIPRGTTVDSEDIRAFGDKSQSEDGGEHGYEAWPYSSWAFPDGGIRPVDVFGDELSIISKHIEFIETPPEYYVRDRLQPSVSSEAPWEVMNNSQSDDHCISRT